MNSTLKIILEPRLHYLIEAEIRTVTYSDENNLTCLGTGIVLYECAQSGDNEGSVRITAIVHNKNAHIRDIERDLHQAYEWFKNIGVPVINVQYTKIDKHPSLPVGKHRIIL